MDLLSDHRKMMESVKETKVLREQFLKETDPTIAVAAYIEAINPHLSKLKQAYVSYDSQREKIREEAIKIAGEIELLSKQLAETLERGFKAGPEDSNDSMTNM